MGKWVGVVVLLLAGRVRGDGVKGDEAAADWTKVAKVGLFFSYQLHSANFFPRAGIRKEGEGEEIGWVK